MWLYVEIRGRTKLCGAEKAEASEVAIPLKFSYGSHVINKDGGYPQSHLLQLSIILKISKQLSG